MMCTRCNGSGFLNIDQVDDSLHLLTNPPDFCKAVLKWIKENENHDVTVCDCCGDGENWYGTPGEHYNFADPPGPNGPYDYNGGWCECH